MGAEPSPGPDGSGEVGWPVRKAQDARPGVRVWVRNPGPTCLPAAHQRGFVGAVWEPRLFLLRWDKVGFGAGVGWEQR